VKKIRILFLDGTAAIKLRRKIMKTSKMIYISMAAAIVLCFFSISNAQTISRTDVPTEIEMAANVTIAGTWYVHATPNGGPPFRGLITFSEGGGMIASAQGDNLPAFNSLATPGHGAWTRTGNRVFLFTFVQILYGPDGEYEGEIRVRHNATMNRAGTTWNGNLTLEVFDPTGELVHTGTGSGTATRIVPMPLLP
jgi:hypothetical protein